jgi:hypothetical protein
MIQAAASQNLEFKPDSSEFVLGINPETILNVLSRSQ